MEETCEIKLHEKNMQVHWMEVEKNLVQQGQRFQKTMPVKWKKRQAILDEASSVKGKRSIMSGRSRVR